MISTYQPRLVIHVVWHPEFKFGAQIAERLYVHFTRDAGLPQNRGLGIPVFFRSAAAPGATVPPAIDLDEARHTAVIVLVDAKMVIEEGWDAYVTDLWRKAGAAVDRHRLFPVACADGAYNLSPQIGAVNFIRRNKLPEDANGSFTRFFNAITNDLVRLITQRPSLADLRAPAGLPASPARMSLFISHAKLDGEATALVLKKYIGENLALDTFFDTINIDAGFEFEQQINDGIDNAAFAVVHTDAYASRVWCQHEIIRAKRHGRPIVVIHAIEKGEARSFPYLGNVPTIRWSTSDPDRAEEVVCTVLREVLRAEHFQQHFEDLRELFHVSKAVRALPRAPELLTCLALRKEIATVPFFVYPDPPLAKQELDILTDLEPNLRLTTPTLLFTHPAQGQALSGQELQKVASGCRIGLSISDSADLPQRGFGPAHLKDAATEFARFLLAAGATLAYGGDLRQGGFSEVLFELQSAYRAISGDMVDAVQSYLSWPIYLGLDDEQKARLKTIARFHPISPPADLALDRKVSLPPTTPENRVIWCRCLTTMREEMNQYIHARLLMGGQAKGLGKYPGLAEEALMAIRAKKPVFLIGAFGGCAQAVIEAIQGRKPAALTYDYQAADAMPRDTITLYNAKLPAGGEAIDYPALTAEFERAGIEGLNNGLTKEENEELFTSTHLPEMIALVLRGLANLGPRP